MNCYEFMRLLREFVVDHGQVQPRDYDLIDEQLFERWRIVVVRPYRFLLSCPL